MFAEGKAPLLGFSLVRWKWAINIISIAAAEMEQAISKQNTAGYSWEIISVFLGLREQRSLAIAKKWGAYY